MRRVRCSAWLCLCLKPNSSLRNCELLLNSFRTLMSRIFSNSLSIESSRRIRRYDESSAESFPGFRMKTSGYPSKLAGNTGFEKSCLVPWRGWIKHLVENPSKLMLIQQGYSRVSSRDYYHSSNHLLQQLVHRIKVSQRGPQLVIPNLDNWWFTDLRRQLRVSLVICLCPRNRLFKRISSWIRVGIRDRGSSCGRHLEVDSANAIDIALDNSLTNERIATSFRKSVVLEKRW
jgi:hypothetical protein